MKRICLDDSFIVLEDYFAEDKKYDCRLYSKLGITERYNVDIDVLRNIREIIWNSSKQPWWEVPENKMSVENGVRWYISQEKNGDGW